MTLRQARTATANKIQSSAPAGALWHNRVLEADVVRPSTLISLSSTLPAAESRTVGSAGPAIVIATAPKRDENNAIMICVYTVVRSRVDLKRAPHGPGRGLAVVDIVEAALRSLPGTGMLPLQTVTEPSPLPVRYNDNQLGIWLTTCLWPPAVTTESVVEPDDPDAGGAVTRIRKRIGDGLAVALDLDANDDDDTLRRGETEARRRGALLAALVPRAAVHLESERSEFGGGVDLVVRNIEFAGLDGRLWMMPKVMRQDIIGTVTIWHQDEVKCDEAIRKLAQDLHDAYIVWPGKFDAWVLQPDDTTEVEEVTDGDHRRGFKIIGREPAEWDVRAGLAKGELKVSIETDVPLEPATQRATLRGMETTLEYDLAAPNDPTPAAVGDLLPPQ